MRYALKRANGTICDGVAWNKQSHAEHWIQEHIKLFGGLDWRVGGLFKAKHDDPLEVVWSKSHKKVKWNHVEPENPDNKNNP